MTDIVFMDTETLGLHPDAPIWEFAAVLRHTNEPAVVEACGIKSTECQKHLFIKHEPGDWIDDLPIAFQDDYRARFNPAEAVGESMAATLIAQWLDGAVVIGCNPGFDLERITKLLQRNGIPEPGCHYHPLDISSIAIGALAVRGELFPQPWKSDALANALGVTTANFERHTALGDVLWTVAQWDAVMGGVQ